MRKLILTVLVAYISSGFLWSQQNPVSAWPLNKNCKDILRSYHAIAGSDVTFKWDADRQDTVAVLDGSAESFIELDKAMLEMKYMSLALWFKVDELREWANVFAFGRDQSGTGYENYIFFTPHNGDINRPQLTVNSGDEGTSVCRVSCDTNLYGNETITTNEWHHVAVTMDSATVAFYMDGALIDEKGFTFSPSIFNVSLAYLGKSLWPDPLFVGKVHDMLLYNRALSVGEINNIYNGIVSVDKVQRSFNPTILSQNGELYIDFDEQSAQRAEIRIYNVTGSLVMSDMNYTSNSAIPLNRGLYIVRMSLDGLVFTEKVFVGQ